MECSFFTVADSHRLLSAGLPAHFCVHETRRVNTIALLLQGICSHSCLLAWDDEGKPERAARAKARHPDGRRQIGLQALPASMVGEGRDPGAVTGAVRSPVDYLRGRR